MEIKAYINKDNQVEYLVGDSTMEPLALAAFILLGTKEQIIERFGDNQPTVVLESDDPRLIKAKKQVDSGFADVYSKF